MFRNRSAKTGQFVNEQEVKNNPNETVSEHVEQKVKVIIAKVIEDINDCEYIMVRRESGTDNWIAYRYHEEDCRKQNLDCEDK